MRIAILPLVGFRNYLSESDVLVYLNFARCLLEAGEPSFCYMILPGADTKANVKLPQLPNLAYLTEPFFEFMDQELVVSEQFLRAFNPRIGLYPVDAVITSRSAAGAWLAQATTDMRGSGARIPVFVNEPKVAEFGATHQAVDDTEMLLRVCGYMAAHPVVLSPRERDLLIQGASRYLAPAQMAGLRRRVMVHAPGIRVGELAQVWSQAVKSDQFTVFFGGRVNDQSKRAGVAFEIMERFLLACSGSRGLICNPRTFPPSFEKRVMFEAHENASRDEFLALASTAHAFVSASAQEEFTVGLCEMFMVGLVGVLPKRDWLLGMFGQDLEEWYPYVYQGQEQAVRMLLDIQADYARAQEYADRVRAKIVALCDRSELKLWHAMREIVAEQQVVTISAGMRKLWSEALQRMPSVFGLEEFVALAAEGSFTQIKPGHRNNRGRWEMRRWLLQNGCVDLYNAPEIMFERQERK